MRGSVHCGSRSHPVADFGCTGFPEARPRAVGPPAVWTGQLRGGGEGGPTPHEQATPQTSQLNSPPQAIPFHHPLCPFPKTTCLKDWSKFGTKYNPNTLCSGRIVGGRSHVGKGQGEQALGLSEIFRPQFLSLKGNVGHTRCLGITPGSVLRR